MGWLRWLGIVFAVLIMIAAGAYYWGFVESSGPAATDYKIDLAEVRSLAASIKDEYPTEIRVEHVDTIHFPLTIMIAGESWTQVDVPVLSYQVASPSSSVIIDTAMPKPADESMGPVEFDAAAYQRMHDAMKAASLVVITHEHPDHIGGLAAHPDLPAVLAHTQLTKEQVENPKGAEPIKFPAGALDGYAPITYERYKVVAPGIVLIKAPGHTPGSQMVYVRLTDGKEYLFLGDVAWRYENVDRVRGRSRFVSSYFLGEDREAVMQQLVELKRIQQAEPNLIIVPGHDVIHNAELVKSGALIQGFK